MLFPSECNIQSILPKERDNQPTIVTEIQRTF